MWQIIPGVPRDWGESDRTGRASGRARPRAMACGHDAWEPLQIWTGNAAGASAVQGNRPGKAGIPYPKSSGEAGPVLHASDMSGVCDQEQTALGYEMQYSAVWPTGQKALIPVLGPQGNGNQGAV